MPEFWVQGAFAIARANPAAMKEATTAMIRLMAWISFFVALLATTPLAWAIDPGIAEGTIVIGKTTVPLKTALAHAYDDAEGLGEGPELRILLTDRPVAAGLLRGYGTSELETAAREGKLKGVLLRVDPKKPTGTVNGTLLLASGDPQRALTFFTADGGPPAFERFQLGDNRVVGTFRLRLDGEEDGEGALAIDATFSAPVFQDPPITARLAGKEALESAPAQAVLAYETALRAGDLSALPRHATPARVREVEAYQARMGDKAFRAMVEQAIPDAAVRRKQPWKVFVRGDRATVIIHDNEGEQIQALVRDNDGWKVE